MKIKQESRNQNLEWPINFFLDLLHDLPNEILLCIVKRLKLIDVCNISISSKRFCLVYRAYKVFAQKMLLSKRIFGFCQSDYQELLLTDLLQLDKEISEEFKSLIKKKQICVFTCQWEVEGAFFELLPFRIFYHVCLLLPAWKQNCRYMHKIFCRCWWPEKKAQWYFFHFLFWF